MNPEWHFLEDDRQREEDWEANWINNVRGGYGQQSTEGLDPTDPDAKVKDLKPADPPYQPEEREDISGDA